MVTIDLVVLIGFGYWLGDLVRYGGKAPTEVFSLFLFPLPDFPIPPNPGYPQFFDPSYPQPN